MSMLINPYNFVAPVNNTFEFTIDSAATTGAPSGAKIFKIPLVSDGVVDFNVDWGDSTNDDITAWNQAECTHTYAVDGIYEIKITGIFRGWQNDQNTGYQDGDKVTTISNWGCFILSQDETFKSCDKLGYCSATDAPTIEITTFFMIFGYADLFDMYMGAWDMSGAIDLEAFAYSGDAFTGEGLQFWNIGNLTNAGNLCSAGSIATPTYDAILINWEAQTHQSDVRVSFGSSNYSAGAAATARAALIADGWTITDGGQV